MTRLFGALLSMLVAMPVYAQTLTQVTHGDWLLVCNQADENSVEQCALTHSVVAPQSNAQLLGVTLTYDKATDTFPTQFSVPLGTSLASGFLLEVEGEDPLSIAFTRCDARGCYIEQILSRDVVGYFDKGVKVTFADRLAQPLAITLSSNGAGAGLADLEDRAFTWGDTAINSWEFLSSFFGGGGETVEEAIHDVNGVSETASDTIVEQINDADISPSETAP